MMHYLWPVCAGISVSIICIVVLSLVAEKINLLDEPDERKSHEVPTPVVGGIAVYLAVLSYAYVFGLESTPLWILASGAILVVVGSMDDMFGLTVRVRVVAQITAACTVMYGSGLWLKNFGLEDFGISWIPIWLSLGVTAFAVVGLTNSFNMVDGIDGLAASQLLVSLLVMVLTSVATAQNIPQPEWLILLASSVLAFLGVNLGITSLRKVFLGDSGSLFLGFSLSWVLIYYSQKPVSVIHPVAALWCVAYPAWDTLAAISYRLSAGKSPFASDRKHLHYLLLDLGYSPRHALVYIICGSFFVSSMGVSITYLVSPVVGLLAFIVFLFVYALILVLSLSRKCC